MPGQYRQIDGRHSLLSLGVARAAHFVPPDRIAAAVSPGHFRWWSRELDELQPANVLMQPLDRGSGAAVLLCLLHLLKRNSRATVVVLPCDQFVEREDLLVEGILRAVQAARQLNDRIVLLGAVPERSRGESGWIVPAPPEPGSNHRGIAEIVEGSGVAASMIQKGALLNTGIFAATGSALLHLFDSTVPGFVGALVESRRRRGTTWSELSALYQLLPTCDFVREILQRMPVALSVTAVAHSGWTDLGSPVRLRAFLQGRRPRSGATVRPGKRRPAAPSGAPRGA